MSTSVSVATHGATSRDGTNTAHEIIDGTNAVDDANWFAVAARELYPIKAGTALYLTTGLGDERLCQRYAAGHTRAPAYFLRALLRGDHGEQWLNATMAPCNSQWWLDLGAAREFLSQYRISKR